jgi:hypothetical protein
MHSLCKGSGIWIALQTLHAVEPRDAASFSPQALHCATLLSPLSAEYVPMGQV